MKNGSTPYGPSRINHTATQQDRFHQAKPRTRLIRWPSTRAQAARIAKRTTTGHIIGESIAADGHGCPPSCHPAELASTASRVLTLDTHVSQAIVSMMTLNAPDLQELSECATYALLYQIPTQREAKWLNALMHLMALQ